MWYVYMLKCCDGAIYTGVTSDIERRYQEHIKGKGGHFTNYNRPEKILFQESFENRSTAEQREQQIKRWSRAKKLALISGHKTRIIALSKSRER